MKHYPEYIPFSTVVQTLLTEGYDVVGNGHNKRTYEVLIRTEQGLKRYEAKNPNTLLSMIHRILPLEAR